MPITVGHDTAKTRKTLTVGDQSIAYYSIPAATEAGLGDFSNLPAALKVVLENMLRFEDDKTVTVDDIKAFAEWGAKGGKNPREIAYRPARVLMQDFTGVPAVVDLAAMRDGLVALGGDPEKINPLNPVDLVIDHSVMIDEFGNPRAFQMNVDREYERNMERYTFLKWGQSAFNNFRVVPPGTGICHQVNLEYLAQTVWTDTDQDGAEVAYPDTLVGTDSHTTMVNGAAVLGWGVGGIEAEAAMLGQPISMLIPEVIGFELTGSMMEGTTGTDLVLKVVEMLRAKGVVGKFVEFYGEGLDRLPLADRATIANMAPEYGATCGFFPIDGETLRYLRNTGRDEARIALVEAYAKAQGLWREDNSPDPVFTDTLSLDLATIQPSLAGPKRPQDRVTLANLANQFKTNDFPSFSGLDSYAAKRSEAIAGEKAGIIKRRVPCIVGPQDEAGLDVIEARAARLGAPVLAYGQHWHASSERDGMIYQDEVGLLDLPRPVLPGDHQIQNAGMALAALRHLGCDEAACLAAVTLASWPARMQRLRSGLLAETAADSGAELWLDGGHNPAAGHALASVLRSLPERPVHMICGMLNTKDARGYLAPLAKVADSLTAVSIPGEAATLPAAETAKAARGVGMNVSEAENVDAALSEILAHTPHARVLICGSLYLAGAVLRENG